VLDVFREGATRLRVVSGQSETSLLIDFTTDSLAGRLKLQVFPVVRITDQLLFV
jgi:hypothetical protein